MLFVISIKELKLKECLFINLSVCYLYIDLFINALVNIDASMQE